MLEQLNGPVGIGVAVVVALIALFFLRKLLSLIFAVAALGLFGWGAARMQGWDVPWMLPGETLTLASGAPAAPSAQAELAADLDGGDLARPEALTTRALGPAPADPAAQAAADTVRTAEIRYNAPERLQLNMPVDLRLAIDTSGMEDLDAALEGLTGDIRGGTAELTGQVTATLTGSGFSIRPLKPGRQVLSDDRPTTWQWEVTPRAEGRRTLILEVFAHPGGGDAAASVREFRDEILVEVTTLSKALDIAQTTQPVVGFVAGGVSLALAFLGVVRRRRRR